MLRGELSDDEAKLTFTASLESRKSSSLASVKQLILALKNNRVAFEKE